MRFCIALCGLCFLVSSVVFAQSASISINQSPNSSYCAGEKIRLSISTTGTFSAANVFSVVVSYYASGNERQKTVSAVLTGTLLEFILDDEDLVKGYSLRVKARSSSPAAESAWSGSFRLFRTGQIAISTTTDTVNAFDEAQLHFRLNAPGYINVTLDDSTKFEFDRYYDAIETTNTQTIRVSQTKTFRIAHASNQCGAFSTSGEARIAVNPVSILPVILAQSICQDSEFTIGISSESPLPQAGKYRVRFIEQRYDTFSPPLVIETEAQLHDGILKGTFPFRPDVPTNSGFFVQIILDNPKSVSTRSTEIIRVLSKPEAFFSSSSRTIDFGQRMDFSISVGGAPPAQVELSDGSVLSSNFPTVFSTVSPAQTTSYTIRSFSTGCGPGVLSSNQTLVVTVKPGIVIDLEENLTLCENQKLTIPVKHNLNITSGTPVFLEANGWDGVVFRFPGRFIASDKIEVDISPLSGDSYYLDQLSWFWVTIPSLGISSPGKYNIRVQTKPYVERATTYDGTILNKPGTINIEAKMVGGGPYTLDVNGVRTTVEGNYMYSNFYATKQKGDFIYSKIRNECFSDEEYSFALSVQVTESDTNPHVHLYNGVGSVCYLDSMEVDFDGYGQFGEGNSFLIQYEHNGQYHTIRSVNSGGKYKVKVPTATAANTYTVLRVSSTNPVLWSSQRYIRNNQAPSNLYLGYEGTTEGNPAKIYPGNEEPTISGNFNGYGPATVRFSDGVTERDFDVADIYFSIPVSPRVGQTEVYTVKSVRNACGTTEFNRNVFLHRVAYQIFAYYPQSSFCTGSPFEIVFSTNKPAPAEPSTEYILQISYEGSNSFRDLARTTGTYKFTGIIPSDLLQGSYRMRVLASDGVVSDETYLTINAPPKATLSSIEPLNSGAIVIEPGYSAGLKIEVSGSGPISAVLGDKYHQIFYGPGVFQVFQLMDRGETLKIRSIKNVCGYGSGTGEVKVNVRPGLRLNAGQHSICEGGNFKTEFRILGDVELGVRDYLVFELWDSSAQHGIPLDSTRSLAGSITLAIPSPLPAGSWSIRAVLRAYSLFQHVGVSVTMKPDMVISGSSTINKGEKTRIVLSSRNSLNFYDITSVVLDNTTGVEQSYTGMLDFLVSPEVTTTYTLKSASSSCGLGTVSGRAVVEVNPVSDRAVSTTSVLSTVGAVCLGDTVRVFFISAGNFSAGNTFKVQVSNENEPGFVDIPTIGNVSPIRAVLPAGLSDAARYRLRVAASDPGTASGAWQESIIPARRASASFVSENAYFERGKTAEIVVRLEGTPPWYYSYGTDLVQRARYSYRSPDTLQIDQASPSLYYKLYSVQNSCGLGSLAQPSTLRVELITSTEPSYDLQVKVGPVPVRSRLNVYFETSAERNLSLYTVRGQLVRRHKSNRLHDEVDLESLPGGVYILLVEEGQQRRSFRIVKD